jgi:hypothetical protein
MDDIDRGYTRGRWRGSKRYCHDEDKERRDVEALVNRVKSNTVYVTVRPLASHPTDRKNRSVRRLSVAFTKEI